MGTYRRFVSTSSRGKADKATWLSLIFIFRTRPDPRGPTKTRSKLHRRKCQRRSLPATEKIKKSHVAIFVETSMNHAHPPISGITYFPFSNLVPSSSRQSTVGGIGFSWPPNEFHAIFAKVGIQKGRSADHVEMFWRLPRMWHGLGIRPEVKNPYPVFH